MGEERRASAAMVSELSSGAEESSVGAKVRMAAGTGGGRYTADGNCTSLSGINRDNRRIV